MPPTRSVHGLTSMQSQCKADTFHRPFQDYDLDYDDDDDDEGGEDADAENMYYKAKGKTTQAPVTSARTLGADRIFYAYSVLAGQVEDEPEDALVAFREIVDAEESKGDWSVRLPLPLVPSTSRALALTLRRLHRGCLISGACLRLFARAGLRWLQALAASSI